MGILIHPTAIVSEKAIIKDGVYIGPFSIIEDDVTIQEDVKIDSHVVIKSYTFIDKGTCIFKGAVIGEIPQHRDFKSERSFVKIGKKNIIREYVTIHRAVGEEGVTEIGNENFIMAAAHIAHNCKIGNRVVITNFAGITGHVEIEDYATISGLVAIHQFTKIGKYAMIGGASKVTQDIPPFMLANGNPAVICGLNIVGLQRHSFSSEKIRILKEAFKILYKKNLNTSDALKEIEENLPQIQEILYLIDFIKKSKRGICKQKRK